MLNRIWFWLLVLGLLYGFGKSAWNSWHGYSAAAVAEAAGATETQGTTDNQAPAEEVPAQTASDRSSAVTLKEDRRNLQQMGRDVNAAVLNSAKVSVEICIGLIGIMALWLGLMKIAEDSGLVNALARLLGPLMRWLFPDVPDGHPAQGAMLMNIAANVLGLENAATPLGIKAMQELQELNGQKDTATDAMATFLAINTSNVQLIPFTIIGYRLIAGSTNPAGPLAGIILTTSVATVVAVIVVRLLAKSPRYAVPETSTSQDESSEVS